MKVYMGGFRLPTFAHFKNILDASEHSQPLLVLIGSANVISERNPFSYIDRKAMLLSHPEVKRRSNHISIDCLYDYPGEDDRWVAGVRNTVGLYTDSPTLIGAKKDESSYYLDAFKDWNCEFSSVHLDHEGKPYNSTYLRELYRQKRWNELELYTHQEVVRFLQHARI